MITAAQCLARYGKPENEHHMSVFRPAGLGNKSVIPQKIYCNVDLQVPLQKALNNVVERNLMHEILEWNGCFNIRKKKGNSSPSLHSWGLAIDINAATNAYRKTPAMSKELVKCFTDAGFIWGGEWRIPDGMHFQLAVLP